MLKGYSYAAALLSLACFTQMVHAAPACSTIAIAPPTTIPAATAGTPYGPQPFTASGSSATPYAYDLSSGLPAGSGLSIDASGVLSGTPTQAGSFLMTVTATDTNGCTGGRTYELDVAVGDQTISYTSTAPAAASVGGATYDVTATATSGLPVSFTIDASATSVCSIAGSTVSFLTAGTCVIDANQAGNASFNAAPQVQQSFAVGKGNQSITFTSVPPNNPAIGGPMYTVTATSTSGLAVTFTIDALASSVCSISGSTVSFTGSGNCVIDANQAGDANYNAAAQAQQTFGVAKTAQTITFTSSAPAGATVGGPTYNVTATATSSLTVIFTIDATASSICFISGSTVSFIAAGTCVVDANQGGNATYAAAPQVQQSFAVGKGNQTITFTSTAPAGATVGGATYNVTGTATSGLAVAFTIDAAASSICSITGNTVSFIGAGTCVIDANQAGNANYNAAPQQQQSFAVGKGNQTINFTSTAPVGAAVGGPTYTVTATATSGLTVALTIDAASASVCTLAGSTVSFIGVGTCVIDANQAGDANYNAAAQAIQSFAVGKGTQTITFTSVPPGSPIVGGPTYNVTATSNSALTVTFTIDATASSVCSISGSTVSFIGQGTCVIDADQAGDANWNAAPQAQQSFGVNKQNQTISFTSTAPVGAVVGGPTYAVTATATSGLTVTFTIDATASSICSIAGSTVSFIGAGTCVIDANQAGDTTYNAALQVQQSFAVGKGNQTINFTSSAPVGATVGGPTYTVTATATSGLAVTLSIDASAASVCSIAGSTVSFIGAGTCVIDANQAGDANWNAAAQAQQCFAVGPGSQTISFTSSPGSPIVGGPTYTVSATATSGLTVTFTIDAAATSICSIAGSTVSFIGAGTCVIDANQAGNANYNAAAQAQQSFAVGKGIQTIVYTSTAPGSAQVGGPTYSVTATGGPSGNPVVFTIDATATSICSIAGNTVSFTAVGTCVIDADQAGSPNYNAAFTAQQSFGVAIGDQTITYTSAAPAATVGGPTYDVTATATSGLTVTFSIDATATSICTINTVTNTVSFIAVGTCVIDADQAGDANWNPAPQAQQSVTVNQGSQTISFTSSAPATAKVGGPTYTVTATATSGLPVTFTIDATATSVCSIAGSTVSFLTVGTCKIDANQAGNANYTAAPQQQQSFAVAKGDQTINFTSTAPVGAKVNDPAYTVTATGGASGNAVTFTIDATATSVCSIVGSTVSLNAGGTCVIDANQAGNANYNAAPQQQQSFVVAKLDQTITFTSTAPGGAKVGGATYTVTATASSGLTVTFSNGSTACNVAGATVSFVHAATCIVNADQAGNAQYNAAPQVQQSFAVAKGDQTINVSTTAPTFGSASASASPHTYTIAATATSGLTVTFTTVGACTNAAGLVTFGPSAGTCTINADQAGNADWNPAPQVQQSTTVEIPASADADSNTVTGNVAINVLVGSTNNVLNGDTGTAIAIKSFGVNGNEQTTLGSATPTAQAGSVTLNANGSYSYDPPANFTGTDTFKYIIGNDLAATSTGTVTLTITDRIIVVASGASGNCKPATPCALSTADALAAPSGKDLVFVQSGSYAAPNATIALNANQNLAGNFVSLTQAISDATITLATESVAPVIAASTTPTLTNAGSVITLGGGNLVEYFSITNSAGSAILGSAAGSGTSNIHDIAVTDGGNAGNGVNITANLGTLNFSNLVVTTSSGNAFAATGGGTVNVTTGSTPNTLTSTTGTALNVANTTIGASNITFKSISANGGTNGIVLNNTGAGVLTVTGDASTNTCKTGNTSCSGGTIQAATGDGILLTSAKVNLSLMWIKNNANSGIKGTTIPGLKLTDMLIQNNTNATGEQAGILINDLSDGAATVIRAEVSGSTEDNVRIHNSAVTGTVTFTSCTIKNNSTASGNNGLFVQTNSTGNLTATVNNSTFTGNRTIALSGDSGDGSTLSATFANNTISAGAPNQGNQGIQVSRALTSALTFNVTGNTVSGMISTLINVFSSGGPGTATGDVKNNIVTGVGVGGNQIGIRLFNSGSSAVGFGTMNVNVANNTVSAIDNAYPILGEASGSTGAGGTLKIAVTGNNASVASGGTALDSIRLQARNTSSLCAQMSGNTTDSGGPGFFGMQVRQANTAGFNLEGLALGSQTDPTVHNFIAGQNPSAASVGTLAGVSSGPINGVAAGSCGITP